ncbi:hypothetical protein R3P38DRAFT_2851179 [Favolaschia claudopus]|uniref:F-box domain-containing protein n=1 Tax=Favolaschia claudopus TaxID=2862362 RepID=A0AAW0DSI0_9AGAR
MDAAIEPKLPQELERLIFEAAARLSPVHAPSLMLVAWRVKFWVEPFLYRVIYHTSRDQPERHGFPIIPLQVLTKLFVDIDPGCKPSNEHRAICEKVQYVYIDDADCDTVPPSLLERIAFSCPNIADIFFQSPSFSEIGSTTSLSLTALSSLRNLTHLTANTSAHIFLHAPADFTHPLFRNITHLSLNDFPALQNATQAYSSLSSIPNLTHIAFKSFILVFAIFPSLAVAPTQIVCFVVFVPASFAATGRLSAPFDDDRLVAIVEDGLALGRDWCYSVCGTKRGGYWADAEAFIARRRNGKIPNSRWVISKLDRARLGSESP